MRRFRHFSLYASQPRPRAREIFCVNALNDRPPCRPVTPATPSFPAWHVPALARAWVPGVAGVNAGGSAGQPCHRDLFPVGGRGEGARPIPDRRHFLAEQLLGAVERAVGAGEVAAFQRRDTPAEVHAGIGAGARRGLAVGGLGLIEAAELLVGEAEVVQHGGAAATFLRRQPPRPPPPPPPRPVPVPGPD